MTKSRYREHTVTGAYSADKADSGKDRIRKIALDPDTGALASDAGTRNVADWVEENSTQSAAIHPTSGVKQRR